MINEVLSCPEPSRERDFKEKSNFPWSFDIYEVIVLLKHPDLNSKLTR